MSQTWPLSGSLGIHVVIQKIATNCHELSRKGQKIRDNSRKFVAKLTLKIITP